MINAEEIQNQLQEFLDEHGHYVNTVGKFVFRDGAVLEHGTMGRLIQPPEDKWEKAKIVAEYWLTVSQQDEQAFDNYKSYLGGFGQREPAWANLYTEEDRLAYLSKLQMKAKRSRIKYMAAKRKVKENVPFWMEEHEQQEVDESRKKHAFSERLDDFQL